MEFFFKSQSLLLGVRVQMELAFNALIDDDSPQLIFTVLVSQLVIPAVYDLFLVADQFEALHFCQVGGQEFLNVAG